MMYLVFVGLLACACAAPHVPRPQLPSPHLDDLFHQRFIRDKFFDTRSFWEELRRELLSVDTVIDDFNKHFPRVSSEAVDGNVFRITIPLQGFEEKDIAVKATNSLVMVQAIHTFDGGFQKTYMDMRSLPPCVNGPGQWTYENDVLKIEFPLKKHEEAGVVTEASREDQSREEMEPQQGETNHDADVGAERGDLGKEQELLTNEVPRSRNTVEATTYAVDLKDEVEFVPVRY